MKPPNVADIKSLRFDFGFPPNSAIDIKDLQILKTCEQVLQEKVQNIASRKPPKLTIGANGKIVEKNGLGNKAAHIKAQNQKGGKSPPQQKSDSTRNGTTPKKNVEQQNGARTPKSKVNEAGDANTKNSSSQGGKGSGSCKRLSYQETESNGYHGNKGEMSKEDGGGGGKGDGNRRRHPSAGMCRE